MNLLKKDKVSEDKITKPLTFKEKIGRIGEIHPHPNGILTINETETGKYSCVSFN